MAWLSARAGESLGFCKGRRGGPDREARAVCRACGAPGGVAGSRRADANRRARPGHRSSAAASSASRLRPRVRRAARSARLARLERSFARFIASLAGGRALRRYPSRCCRLAYG
ncbi:hypothetical protein DM45_2549 [Burkholderia mallei]|nr:hypothetical protein DM46_1464 [Burkholderia mallei]KOS92897.1 hypothetical protein DM45_2549 [Burkholderia mallei]